MAWVMQLLLLVALYFQSFKDSSVGRVVFPMPSNDVIPPAEPKIIPDITLPTSGPILVIFAALGVAFVLFTVYLVIMRYIPAVNETAEKVVHEVTKHAVEQTERHHKKKIPVRKRRALSARITWWLKIGISLLPLFIVLVITGSTLISRQAAVLLMALLSLWAILCFATEATLARLWHATPSVD